MASKSSLSVEEEPLSAILGRLGLGDYEETFHKEQIDTEALVGLPREPGNMTALGGS